MPDRSQEGGLAAQLHGLDLKIPPAVIARALGWSEEPKRATTRRLTSGWRRSRITLALAIALSGSVGTGVLAVDHLTGPANAHGQPMSSSGGPGFDARLAPPGHSIQTTADEAGRLAGFNVVIIVGVPGAVLKTVTYVPELVPAGQPTPRTGGSVSLDYIVQGTEVLINEGLDPNPSEPLQVNQKIAPGYTGPLCISVETIEGGQYVLVRCPD